jgi:MFS family permease
MKARTVLSGLVFLGQAQNYMVRVSISLIVLAMVRSKSDGGKGKESAGVEERCGAGAGNSTAGRAGEEGELDWDAMSIGLVFSSFGWGYMATQILGGRLAELYGFKKVRRQDWQLKRGQVYGLGVLGPGLLQFLHPIAANTDVRLFIGLRVAMGVMMGGTWPAMHVITARLLMAVG